MSVILSYFCCCCCFETTQVTPVSPALENGNKEEAEKKVSLEPESKLKENYSILNHAPLQKTRFIFHDCVNNLIHKPIEFFVEEDGRVFKNILMRVSCSQDFKKNNTMILITDLYQKILSISEFHFSSWSTFELLEKDINIIAPLEPFEKILKGKHYTVISTKIIGRMHRFKSNVEDTLADAYVFSMGSFFIVLLHKNSTKEFVYINQMTSLFNVLNTDVGQKNEERYLSLVAPNLSTESLESEISHSLGDPVTPSPRLSIIVPQVHANFIINANLKQNDDNNSPISARSPAPSRILLPNTNHTPRHESKTARSLNKKLQDVVEVLENLEKENGIYEKGVVLDQQKKPTEKGDE